MSTRNLKKHIATLLLAAICVSSAAAMISCSEAADNSNDAVSGDIVTEAEETEAGDALENRKSVDDGLGSADYEERDFRMVCYGGNTAWYILEEETGDVVDDAIIERTRTVEERFNVKVKSVFDGNEYWDSSDYIKRSVNAQEDAIDLISMHVVESGTLSQQDVYLNWYNIPHVDFTKPWWSDSNINDLSYKNVCFVAVGDMNMTAIRNTYAFFYNKRLGANFNVEDPMAVAAAGDFTYDWLIAQTKNIYEDYNQDGAISNQEDLFGFCSCASSPMDAFLWAFDNPIFKKENDGSLAFTYKTERLVDIITKLRDTINQCEGMRAEIANKWGYSTDMFYDSLAVFANGKINMAIVFRDMADDFSILPYPKWDDKQSNYHTLVDGSHEVLSVPVTASDTDFIGVITEAMNSESYKTVVPAYYDVALKVKGARDEKSVEMLDIIVNSRIFDFGYVYDGWEGCSFFLTELFNNPTTNIESFWAENENKVTTHYNSVIAYFENYGK